MMAGRCWCYEAPCEPVPAIIDQVLAAIGDVQPDGKIHKGRLLVEGRKAGLTGENLQFSAGDALVHFSIRLENKALLVSGVVPLELEIEDVPHPGTACRGMKRRLERHTPQKPIVGNEVLDKPLIWQRGVRIPACAVADKQVRNLELLASHQLICTTNTSNMVCVS